MRPLPTLKGESPFVQGVLTNLAERISLALTQRLELIGGRAQHRADRPAQHLKRRRVQPTLDPPPTPSLEADRCSSLTCGSSSFGGGPSWSSRSSICAANPAS